VKDAGAPPVAGFSAAPAAGVAPLAVSFFDQSTTNTASWSWDLDGDGAADSVSRDPSFVYSSPGLYDVTLTASNASGSNVDAIPGRICVAGALPGGPADVDVSSTGSTITWSPVPGAGAYDVIRGGLLLLRSAGGDFSAASITCIDDDGTGLTATDAAVPIPGTGFFYLVRSLGDCSLPGTYDGTDGEQAAPRDAGIASTTGACP